MKLTAMDINNKEFKKVFRGYDIDEVDEFLDEVTENYEVIYKENSVLKEKNLQLTEKIEHYSKIEDTIQNTLLLAQNAAEQAKNSAQKEAELILRNANDSAQRILDKAHNDVLQVTDEYEKLKQEFSKFKTRYRSFMNSQLEMFESLDKEFSKNYNVGNVIEEVKEKDIENSSEFKVKDIADETLATDDLNEIKSFFAKEK